MSDEAPLLNDVEMGALSAQRYGAADSPLKHQVASLQQTIANDLARWPVNDAGLKSLIVRMTCGGARLRHF